MTWSGACHCGNITVALESALEAPAFEIRACQCSFCRKHGARAVSDPRGRVRFSVREPDALVRYRFALRTAEFLVCARCGIYVAAVLGDGGGSYATVNVNVLDRADEFSRAVTPVSYEAETETARRARRVARWTPATLAIARR
jgi:hypothetical protein